jgi:hypothetical protein
MIMKDKNKATNLRLGAIYNNANTGTPCRLVHIVPCQGAWLETYDGQGYGDTIKFEDVHYADSDEVEDFLADHRVYAGSAKAPTHKDLSNDDVIVERGVVQADDVYYDKGSYYTDSHGYDCRDHDQNAYNYPIDETDCWN